VLNARQWVFRKAKKFGAGGSSLFAIILILSALLGSLPSAFGQASETPIKDMNAQASTLYGKGQYTAALEKETKALALARSSLGTHNQVTADCLNEMGEIYRDLGDYTNAEAVFKESLQIREDILGLDHTSTAQSLGNLGLIYVYMGRYNEAEPMLQQALSINEKATGLNSMADATSLAGLGAYYTTVGDYSKAEDCDKQTLEIDRSVEGGNGQETVTAMNNLAVLEMNMGDYSMAEPLLEQVLKIDEKRLGPNHPDVGGVMNTLGTLYYRVGDYAKAESYFTRAQQIAESSFGPDSPNTASTLSGLAMLYMDMGDYEKAAPLIDRTLTIDEKSLGTNHPVIAGVLGKIAGAYARAGNFAAAETLDKRVLKIDENAVGPDSPLAAVALLNLGMVDYLKGEYSKSEAYDEQAIAIQEKTLSPDHPDAATAFNNLSDVYAKRGDYATAISLEEKAEGIDEQVLGLANPSTAIALADLATYNIDLQNTNEAIQYAQRVEESRLAALNNVFSFASEQQRLNYAAQTDPYILFASLNDAPDLAQAVLRHKGVVLDSLLEDKVVARASADPDYKALINQLEPAKRRLTQLTMLPPKDFSQATLTNRYNEYEKLSSRVDELEGALARNVAGFGQVRRALTVTVAQVQRVIPSQAVLVEYVSYNHYLGRGKSERRYGAIIISANEDTQWVCLGNAMDIEKNVLNYQESVRQDEEGKLSRTLHKLYSQVWAPLEAAFPPGTKTTIISPDGALNFVSFATLLAGDNHFLGEKYSFRYVASGRDLLIDPVTSPAQDMVIFASPDYVAGGMINWEETFLLDPLPYFETEAIDLGNQAKEWGWHVQIYGEDAVTEQQVRALQSPRILQFSTHGFILPALIKGPEKYSLMGFPLDSETPVKVVLRNPMSRSCIALAGAQITLDAWERGEVPPTENDGILTAEEVGELNLHGTWLVVLSACDTGVGQLWSGEGVMGMRRGFAQAGAQNLLMTLWPIYDISSSDIIKDFYVKLHDDNNPPEALAEVQRDWMVKLRAKNGLLSAVVLAGPFIMSSQGPVE
jgi:tetratricopeptide (TPR) repeat protein